MREFKKHYGVLTHLDCMEYFQIDFILFEKIPEVKIGDTAIDNETGEEFVIKSDCICKSRCSQFYEVTKDIVEISQIHRKVEEEATALVIVEKYAPEKQYKVCGLCNHFQHNNDTNQPYCEKRKVFINAPPNVVGCYQWTS